MLLALSMRANKIIPRKCAACVRIDEPVMNNQVVSKP